MWSKMIIGLLGSLYVLGRKLIKTYITLLLSFVHYTVSTICLKLHKLS